MATLARELKKRRPFDLPEVETHLNVVRTAARLEAAFERLFREDGLCAAHYNVLRILAGEKAGGADGMPVLEVRERLITPLPDITRLVDKLVEQKLVRRERTEKDRRVVLLYIAQRGEKLLAELRRRVDGLHAAQLGHMSRAELATLSRLL